MIPALCAAALGLWFLVRERRKAERLARIAGYSALCAEKARNIHQQNVARLKAKCAAHSRLDILPFEFSGEPSRTMPAVFLHPTDQDAFGVRNLTESR